MPSRSQEVGKEIADNRIICLKEEPEQTSEPLQQTHQNPMMNVIVRVAGYSDDFVDLGEALQNEIIERTEQQGF